MKLHLQQGGCWVLQVPDQLISHYHESKGGLFVALGTPDGDAIGDYCIGLVVAGSVGITIGDKSMAIPLVRLDLSRVEVEPPTSTHDTGNPVG